MNRIARIRLASRLSVLLVLTLVLLSIATQAQTTQFTYQGNLTDSGLPATGSYDFQFKLFDALTAGTQIGSTQSSNSVAVSGGTFTVMLDFGANAFPGANRWLELSLRVTGGGAFTTLSPRQSVTSTPYTIKALNAASADSLSAACVGCVTSAQLPNIPVNKGGTNLTTGPTAAGQFLRSSAANTWAVGSIAAGDLPSGSTNYIQNTNAQQASSNFNISGNGIAGGTLSGNVINATTQYNLGGSRILSAPGNSNLFAGPMAGDNNTTGSFNSFFGGFAGNNNTTGNNNSFFGGFAGAENAAGSRNTFIGYMAGNPNSTTPVTNSVAIGANATVSTNDTIVLGTSVQTTEIPGTLTVGGGRVQIVSSPIGGGILASNVYIRQLNQNALPHVCWKPAPDGVPGLLLSACTTAFAPSKLKTDLQPLSLGLDVINRLRPMMFTWKEGGNRDYGLSAEEVAEVEPLLVTRDAKGEVEEVRSENLSALFINAFKEQQAQIQQQGQVARELRIGNDALKQQNANLESRLTALEQMMQQLKEHVEKQPQPKQQ